jgi:putative ABC transport system permease protein
MLRNYLRIAFRNIRRNRLYSLINIGGLAIGIAVCMTILLYTLHEYSYDRFHANARRIFSVSATIKMGKGDSIMVPNMSYPAAPMIKKADSRVEDFVRYNIVYNKINLQDPASPDSKFSENKNFLLADSNFFAFFTFHLVEGNASQVLQHPNTLVITERAAKKYFGSADPVGRRLLFNNEYTFEVTGVSTNPPSNSSINFDFVASLSSLPSMKELAGSLQSSSVQAGAFKTWFLLNDPLSSGQVEKTMHNLAQMGLTEKDENTYHLTALPDGHLGLNFGDVSNTRYLKIFPLVAALTLLLALINYMSLATANAAARAKEVGVRKVLGAAKSKIAGQFYTESAVFALLSFAVGGILFFFIRPYFTNLIQLSIDSSFLFQPRVIVYFIGLLLLVIAVAGSYPALVLSSYNPAATLYGKMSKQRGASRVRRFFTVFQFTISVALIVSSIVIGRQLEFIRHTDTGVDRDRVLTVPFNTTLEHYAAFKTEIEALPGIRQAATAEYPMYRGYNAFFVKPKDKDVNVTLPVISVDDGFISLLGLKWKNKPSTGDLLYDNRHVVINETAINTLNLPPDPIGQRIQLGNQQYAVAGVLKDFNFSSLQNKIEALCLFVGKDTASGWGTKKAGCLFAKMNPRTNTPSIVEAIKKIYGKYDRQTAFAYEFMDEDYDSMYKAEDRLAKLFGTFTLITVLIACMGLFALAAFSAQQRTKEIGIRKVLGASVTGIASMLSKDFLLLVGIAIILASPIAGWAMDKWLRDFVYRIHIGWSIFAEAGLLALLIALTITVLQAVKAARANPAESLRSE